MSLPRFLPKPVFQLVALVLLAGALGVAGQMAWQGDPPYAWIVAAVGSPPLAAALFLLASVIAWLLVVLPLRWMSAMPTFDEEMARMGITSIAEIMDKGMAEQRQVAAAGADRPDLQRRYHARLALGGALCTVIFGTAAAANLVVNPHAVLIAPPLIAIIGLVLAPYHLVRALLIRKG